MTLVVQVQVLLGPIQKQCTTVRSRCDGILQANWEDWAAFEQLFADCSSFSKETNNALQTFENIDRALEMQPKRELPVLPGSSPYNAPNPSFTDSRSRTENPLPRMPPRTAVHNMEEDPLKILPKKKVAGTEVKLSPEEIVLCRGAMILQENTAAAVSDITMKHRDVIVCKYCQLTLPRLDNSPSQAARAMEHWKLLGKSHILACSPNSDFTPCYLCLRCEDQRVFLTAESLEAHLEGAHPDG